MCNKNSGKSKTLERIGERLRLYRSNHCSDRIKLKDSRMKPAGELAGDGIHRSRAAVLICLFEGKDGDLRVILTKRSSTMSSHSGEVALPGGKWEEDDESDVATAMREAKEEIGLEPSIVEVVAVLEPLHTKNERRREEEAEWMGYKYLLHFFDYETDNRCYTIWALTAAILIKAASIIYERPPAFEEHLPKFWSGTRL